MDGISDKYFDNEMKEYENVTAILLISWNFGMSLIQLYKTNL